jgi:hypothetical protein
MPIHPIMTRIANVDTSVTGGSMQLAGPEGTVQFHRVDPHGVVMQYAGQQLSINKELLPVLGRYAMAAALLLGVDINEGWNQEQVAGS